MVTLLRFALACAMVHLPDVELEGTGDTQRVKAPAPQGIFTAGDRKNCAGEIRTTRRAPCATFAPCE